MTTCDLCEKEAGVFIDAEIQQKGDWRFVDLLLCDSCAKPIIELLEAKSAPSSSQPTRPKRRR